VNREDLIAMRAKAGRPTDLRRIDELRHLAISPKG
jgi:hypothetical protein